MSKFKDWLWKFKYECQPKNYMICKKTSAVIRDALLHNHVLIYDADDFGVVCQVRVGDFIIWTENRFYAFGEVNGRMLEADVALALWKKVKVLERYNIDRKLNDFLYRRGE